MAVAALRAVVQRCWIYVQRGTTHCTNAGSLLHSAASSALCDQGQPAVFPGRAVHERGLINAQQTPAVPSIFIAANGPQGCWARCVSRTTGVLVFFWGEQHGASFKHHTMDVQS